jgi:nucleoid-associated protein YgaU
MTTTSMRRLIVPAAVFALAIVVALVFGLQHIRREAPTEAAAAPKPVVSGKEQSPPLLAAVQQEANALASALSGTSAPKAATDDAPTFDIARIEPSGEAVIAGRATPGATVELLRNGEPHDRVVVQASGQFAMVPPRLPAGTYELTLRMKQPDGRQIVSKQSVAVALAPNKNEQPVVALMTPNKPSVVLSQAANAAKQAAAGAVVAEAVEVEAGGKLHVSGRARPGASVRFYLNDSYVASVTAAADGRFAVTINEGVKPGNYRVRLDEMEQNSTAVRARVEVPFNVPDTIVTASAPAQTKTAKPQDAAATAQPRLTAAAGNVAATENSPSTVVIAKIATTTVTRGDNLWQISRLTYGNGMRYAVIYNANREHIRNPDLIYPGQVFVLPTQ